MLLAVLQRLALGSLQLWEEKVRSPGWVLWTDTKLNGEHTHFLQTKQIAGRRQKEHITIRQLYHILDLTIYTLFRNLSTAAPWLHHNQLDSVSGASFPFASLSKRTSCEDSHSSSHSSNIHKHSTRLLAEAWRVASSFFEAFASRSLKTKRYWKILQAVSLLKLVE